MKYKEKWMNGTEDLTEAYTIREKVFCDEQGYSLDMELDEQDKESLHVILCNENIPFATGRLYWTSSDTIRFGRIAVLKEFRGNGIGKIILEVMMKKANSMGAKHLELDSQCYAIGFYEKSGFHICGDEHMDGHVPHKMMVRDL